LADQIVIFGLSPALSYDEGVKRLDQKVRGIQVWDDDRLSEVNPLFFASRLAPAEIREKWRHSAALPWIERSEFTESVLDMVRRSFDAGGAWTTLAEAADAYPACTSARA
jgi:hypothetical protein